MPLKTTAFSHLLATGESFHTSGVQLLPTDEETYLPRFAGSSANARGSRSI